MWARAVVRDTRGPLPSGTYVVPWTASRPDAAPRSGIGRRRNFSRRNRHVHVGFSWFTRATDINLQWHLDLVIRYCAAFLISAVPCNNKNTFICVYDTAYTWSTCWASDTVIRWWWGSCSQGCCVILMQLTRRESVRRKWWNYYYIIISVIVLFFSINYDLYCKHTVHMRRTRALCVCKHSWFNDIYWSIRFSFSDFQYCFCFIFSNENINAHSSRGLVGKWKIAYTYIFKRDKIPNKYHEYTHYFAS